MSSSPRAVRGSLARVLLIGGVLLAGCSRHTEQSVPGDLENIHVTYKSSTHVLGIAEAKELIFGISSNEMGYLLDSKNPAAAGYKVGDSLLVKGLLARKIIAADRTKDGSVILLTQQAHLTDVIQDGKIQLRKPIRFDDEPTAGGERRSASLLSASSLGLKRKAPAAFTATPSTI